VCSYESRLLPSLQYTMRVFSDAVAALRARHLLTVLRLTPSRAATAMWQPPCAHASTIRARMARPCAVLRRLTQFSNLRRSSSDNTSDSSQVSSIPQQNPTASPAIAPGRNLGHNTTHAVTERLKTGSLGVFTQAATPNGLKLRIRDRILREAVVL